MSLISLPLQLKSWGEEMAQTMEMHLGEQLDERGRSTNDMLLILQGIFPDLELEIVAVMLEELGIACDESKMALTISLLLQKVANNDGAAISDKELADVLLASLASDFDDAACVPAQLPGVHRRSEAGCLCRTGSEESLAELWSPCGPRSCSRAARPRRSDGASSKMPGEAPGPSSPLVQQEAPVARSPRAAVNSLFDRAFAASRAAACVAESADVVDVMELSESGVLRVEFSLATATWLAQMAASPLLADLGYLSALCSDRAHPLGALCASFAALFADLHGAVADPAPTEDALSAVSAAAATFKLGSARLHAATLDVLQPLRMLDEATVADVVDAALFEAVAPTLTPLVRAARPHDCGAFQVALRRLAESPETRAALGVPEQWSPDALAPAVEAARRMPQAKTPRAKLGCFLDVCDAAATAGICHDDKLLSFGADELIPACAFALVTAQLHQLPAEVLFIRLFITDELELLGRIGYGLATLEAAASLIQHLAEQICCPAAHEGVCGVVTGSADDAICGVPHA